MFLRKQTVCQSVHLELSLPHIESKVSDNYSNTPVLDIQVCINSATGLSSGKTQIYRANSKGTVSCQQDVAVVAIAAVHGGAGNDMADDSLTLAV